MNQILADYVRWPITAVWFVVLLWSWTNDGVPLLRETLIVWIMVGLICSTLGKRAPWLVLIDWLPFTAFLIAYDYSRGAADRLGMPTQWTPQIDADKFLFGGTVPTIFLQQHLLYPNPQWWEVITGITYLSHFVASFVIAGVLWFLSRHRFRQFAARFLVLSFVGVLGYILVPSAPPWAAARCTAAEVRDHPADPPCLTGFAPDSGALLPEFTPDHDGAPDFVTSPTVRGLDLVNLVSARYVFDKHFKTVNRVAAVPSLHAAFTMLIVVFFWRRAKWWLRPILVVYPLLMGFALVFTGNHYVFDILVGWVCAIAVHLGLGRLEKGWSRRRAAKQAETEPAPSETAPSETAPTEPAPTESKTVQHATA